MNLRDEIAKAAAQFDQSIEGKWHGHQMADALMPIVERVAREVLHDAITAATFDGLGSVDADAIVRRVMGDE